MEKEEELKKIYDNWTDKSINQLSFFNNLLLTISIGIVTISFKDIGISGVEFNFNKINYPMTSLILSLLIINFSILIGLFVALSRLYDFRLTRHICLIKYKFFKKIQIELKSSKIRNKYTFLKRITMLMCLAFSDKTINDKEFNEFIEAKKVDGFEKFDNLREIVFNLGNGTWVMLNWQVGTFIIGMILFLIGFLLK